MAQLEIARRRRHAGGVVAALLSVALATGCGALNDYSATERTTSGSVNVDAGPLALRHLRVELEEGQRIGSVVPVLRGSFVNTGDRDDELLRVTSPGADAVRLAGAGTSQTVALAGGGVARLEHAHDPSWLLEGVSPELQLGTTVPVTFHFAHEGKVVATVPVTSG